MDKLLILLRGVSGSGKTTFATYLGSLLDLSDKDWGLPYLVVSTDDSFTDKDGNYNFNPEMLQVAHLACQEKVRIAMKDERIPTVVVHNTFTEEWEMQPYLDLAECYNYKTVTLVVENRHQSKSVHDVPEYIIQRQKERFEVKL